MSDKEITFEALLELARRLPVASCIDLAALAGVRYDPRFESTLGHVELVETVWIEGDAVLLYRLLKEALAVHRGNKSHRSDVVG